MPFNFPNLLATASTPPEKLSPNATKALSTSWVNALISDVGTPTYHLLLQSLVGPY